MPDIDTIITAVADGDHDPGYLPHLVAEVERLREELADDLEQTFRFERVEDDTHRGWWRPFAIGETKLHRLIELKRWEPHPTEPGLYRRKEGE